LVSDKTYSVLPLSIRRQHATLFKHLPKLCHLFSKR
jgi:hypothetical protein